MSSFKCNFIGRLGADAETVTTGTPFISFRVAVDETFKKETTTSWIRVVADAERYKNMVQYLTKGKAVIVTGSERVSLYSTKDGQPGIDRTVRADSIEFLNIGGGNGQKQEENAAPKNDSDAKNAQMTTGSVKKTKPAPAPEPEPDTDDELPF